MIPYKSKGVHVEYGILNVYHIRNNRNAYLRKEKTVAMTPVLFFYMTSTWVTPSLLGIYISAKISLCKVDTWSYPIYPLVYTLVMQNIGYKQE